MAVIAAASCLQGGTEHAQPYYRFFLLHMLLLALRKLHQLSSSACINHGYMRMN